MEIGSTVNPCIKQKPSCLLFFVRWNMKWDWNSYYGTTWVTGSPQPHGFLFTPGQSFRDGPPGRKVGREAVTPHSGPGFWLNLGMMMLLLCSVAYLSHTACVFTVVGKARFPIGHFSPLAVKPRRCLFRFCEGTHPRLCTQIPTISISLQLLLDQCYAFLYMLS